MVMSDLAPAVRVPTGPVQGLTTPWASQVSTRDLYEEGQEAGSNFLNDS